MNINDSIRSLNVGLPEDILRRKIYGDYEGAVRLIDRRLALNDQPEALRECLIAEKEIMRRLPLDYPLSRSEALALVREHIADFTEEEFDERVDAGQIWWIYVNGEMRYFNRFFASLCKVDAGFSRRAGIGGQGVESAKKGSKEDNLLDITRRRMAEEGHDLANHSWSHKDLAKLNTAAITKEIMDARNKILEISGVETKLVRLPYGSTNKTVRAVAEATESTLVRWSVDPQDWKFRDAEPSDAALLWIRISGIFCIAVGFWLLFKG